MGTNECTQPASKSSRNSQDFDDISMVLKMGGGVGWGGVGGWQQATSQWGGGGGVGC